MNATNRDNDEDIEGSEGFPKYDRNGCHESSVIEIENNGGSSSRRMSKLMKNGI